MCGIAGLYDAGLRLAPGERTAAVGRMRAALRHRGPDMHGDWADPQAGIALGHQRLSIIDLSASGQQPMVSRSGRYVLTYNGEVYNFRALLPDLAARGHVFRGHSDTEVLLAAIEEYGLTESLRRTQGMFALALWDRETRRLTLARDRMGKKPLHYGMVGGVIAFASELKAFPAAALARLEIDPAALAGYLADQYIRAPLSIWKGIAKLPPGCMVTLDAAGIGEPEAWWSLAEVWRQDAGETLDEAEALSGLHAALRTATAERMIADRPVGAFLSGGIDSSLIVALMCEVSAAPVRTFTVGFSDAGFDESAAARAVAGHLGTDHSELRLEPGDLLGLVPEIPEIYDEPFADQSAVPMLQVARFAAGRVTVALSGDGGDELFAGYARYALAARLEAAVGRLPGGVRRALGAGLGHVPAGVYDGILRALPRTALARMALARGAMAKGAMDGLRGDLSGDRLLKMSSLLQAPDRDARYRRMTRLIADPGRFMTAQVPAGEREGEGRGEDGALPPSHLRAMMAWDTMVYLPDDVLVKVDRATMATSLEARSPLLDTRVLECAWRLPESLLRNDGRGKWPLRALLRRYLPDEAIDRPKRGFSVPMAAWLRGPLREWSGDMLDPQRLRRTGLLQPAAVQALLSEHQAGTRNWSGQLWALLMLEEWNRRWNGTAGDLAAAA